MWHGSLDVWYQYTVSALQMPTGTLAVLSPSPVHFASVQNLVTTLTQSLTLCHGVTSYDWSEGCFLLIHVTGSVGYGSYWLLWVIVTLAASHADFINGDTVDLCAVVL